MGSGKKPLVATVLATVVLSATVEVLFGRMTPDAAAQKFVTEANASIAG
ncbi:hypothetical protein ABZ917_37620 [Nonomuraea wenchangensis]